MMRHSGNHAQDGRGIKRPAERDNEFPCSLAVHVRALCALTLFFALLLPAAAADAQSFQVSGTVVDHLSNQPLNHVLVNLVRSSKEGGSVSVLTESDGHFLFTAVPAGRYRLTAQRRGETPQGFRSDGSGYATALLVGPGLPTENLLFPLKTNASINGLVVDDQGEPVAGAQIQLFMQSVVNGETKTVQGRGVVTNAAGEFHIGHLHAATYFVSASGRPWYANAGADQLAAQPKQTNVVYPLTWYGNTTNGESASPIVLTEGSSLNIQIALHAVPGIHVQLPAASGGPQRGMGPIRLFVSGPGGVRVPLSGIGMSNDGVSWQINGIAAGHYEIAPPPDTPGRFFLTKSEPVDLVDGMTLPLPAPSRLSVNGTITFAGGSRPEEDLEVFLEHTGNSAMAEVGEDGTFSFPADQLGAGSYEVRLNKRDLWIESMTVKGGKRLGEKIELPGSGAVSLSLVAATAEHLSELHGFALRNDSAFPGATILLLPLDAGEPRLIRRDQSDSDGSFTLRGIVPGKYTLVAIEDGSNLLYKTTGVMKPYLAGGVPITVPLTSADPLKVSVQTLLPN